MLIFLLRDSHGSSLDILAEVVLGLGFLICLLQSIPALSPFLKLTEEGFLIGGVGRGHFTKWSEVHQFKVLNWILYGTVGIEYSPEYRGFPRWRALARWLKVSNCEGALPDTYGMKAPKLVELLEQCRRKYTPPLTS